MVGFYDEEEFLMTPLQFKYAIAGLGHEKKTLDAMEKLMVEGKKASEIKALAGVSRQRVSKLRAEIIANLQKRLERDGLVSAEVFMTPKQIEAIRKSEEPHITKILKKES